MDTNRKGGKIRTKVSRRDFLLGSVFSGAGLLAAAPLAVGRQAAYAKDSSNWPATPGLASNQCRQTFCYFWHRNLLSIFSMPVADASGAGDSPRL